MPGRKAEMRGPFFTLAGGFDILSDSSAILGGSQGLLRRSGSTGEKRFSDDIWVVHHLLFMPL